MGIREEAVRKYTTGAPVWVSEVVNVLGLWGVERPEEFEVDLSCDGLISDGLLFQQVWPISRRTSSTSLYVVEMHEDGTSRDLGIIDGLWELGEALS